MSHLDRSFPVPRGMIPIAGRPLANDIPSITDKIQPTVPSPPQAEKSFEVLNQGWFNQVGISKAKQNMFESLIASIDNLFT